MADVPNVQYINFVDTELTLHFDAGGSAAAMLTSANNPAVDITGFRKVNILAPYGQNFTCRMLMGTDFTGHLGRKLRRAARR